VIPARKRKKKDLTIVADVDVQGGDPSSRILKRSKKPKQTAEVKKHVQGGMEFTEERGWTSKRGGTDTEELGRSTNRQDENG